MNSKEYFNERGCLDIFSSFKYLGLHQAVANNSAVYMKTSRRRML